MTKPNTRNTATTAKPNLNPLALIEDLHQRQVEWDKEHYRTATAKLLALLADCMDAREQLASAWPLTRQRFANMVDTVLSTQSSAKLTLTGKVVRYVFRITGPRASAYTRVIDTARAEKIDSSKLPAWVIEQGGIEAVRRGTKKRKDGFSPTEIVQRTAAALEGAKPLATITKLPPSMHSSSDNDHDFILALVRHNHQTGAGSVVSASTNNALVKQYLATVAKAVLAEKQNKDTADAGAQALIDKVAARQAAVTGDQQTTTASTETVAA